jgi:hypothetical protein
LRKFRITCTLPDSVAYLSELILFRRKHGMCSTTAAQSFRTATRNASLTSCENPAFSCGNTAFSNSRWTPARSLRWAALNNANGDEDEDEDAMISIRNKTRSKKTL